MKKQKLIAIASGVAGLFIAASAQATAPGPYIGLQAGWANLHQPTFFGNSQKGDGIAGTVFGGMQFNEFIGLELGYTKFSNMNISSSGHNDLGIPYNNSGNIKSYATDVVAKLTMPLQNGISLNGKLGGAYLYEQANIRTTPTIGTSFNQRKTEDKIMPAFGLGASYDINQNVTGDISWLHIQAIGNTDLASTDFLGMGLTYHFG